MGSPLCASRDSNQTRTHNDAPLQRRREGRTRLARCGNGGVAINDVVVGAAANSVGTESELLAGVLTINGACNSTLVYTITLAPKLLCEITIINRLKSFHI